MHDIEPFWNWRDHYVPEEDERSPFLGEEHSEFHFTHAVYDHVIHPQWDHFGSSTLYIKVLFADYDTGFSVIELIGEWNDLLHNDIMMLKRNVIEHMMSHGIGKFILIGENVLNFHGGDDDYYSEWFDETSEVDGWIALLNFRPHVLDELRTTDVDRYFLMGGTLNALNWRSLDPEMLYERVEGFVMRRLSV